MVGELLSFALIIGIMLLGGDIALRGTPALQRRYRQVISAVWGVIRSRTIRFVRWAWREHKQFIIGFAVGVLVALYFLGHFQ